MKVFMKLFSFNSYLLTAFQALLKGFESVFVWIRNSWGRNIWKLGVMVPTCNSSTWESEIEDGEFKDSLGYVGKTLSQKKVISNI
jgi:hypothetical protein